MSTSALSFDQLLRKALKLADNREYLMKVLKENHKE